MDQNEDKCRPRYRHAGDPAEAAATRPAGPVGWQSREPKRRSSSPASIPRRCARDMSDMAAAVPGPMRRKASARRASRGGKNRGDQARAPRARRRRVRADAHPGCAGRRRSERASRRFGKFTLLAASVVLAAAFGAMAGVLATTGVARLAGEPAPAAPLPASARRPPRCRPR